MAGLASRGPSAGLRRADVLRSWVLHTQNAGKKFKLKIGAMAEKDEIVKVENQETRNQSFGFNPDRIRDVRG